MMMAGHLALDISVFPTRSHDMLEKFMIHDDMPTTHVEFMPLGSPQHDHAAASPSTTSSLKMDFEKSSFQQPNSLTSATYATTTYLAPSMATPGDGPAACGVPLGPRDESGLQVADSTKTMAAVSGPHGDGGDAHPVGQVSGSMQPSEVQEVREQVRQVQHVPRLQQEVAMARRPAAMGRTNAVAKAAAAAAFAFIINSFGVPGQQVQASVGSHHNFDSTTDYLLDSFEAARAKTERARKAVDVEAINSEQVEVMSTDEEYEWELLAR